MVLVKKADGTLERVPWRELQQRQKSPPVVATVPRAVLPRLITTPTRVQLPEPLPEPLLPASPPEALLPPAEHRDFGEPLDEPLEGVDETAPAVSPSREAEAAAIVKRLPFGVPPQLQDRLRRIVQLRIKEIRDERASRTQLVAPDSSGGVSLSDSAAAEVLAACRHYLTRGATPSDKNARSAVNAAAALFTPRRGAANAPPANSAIARASDTRLKLEATPRLKPTLTDITGTLPNPTTVGPIEEIHSFTLVDFRRLNPDPAAAALKLEEKFSRLKAESAVLYLAATGAWRLSPLYNDYLAALVHSLRRRTPPGAPRPGQEGSALKPPEIFALAELNRRL